jgi:aromatic-amino-acid transaminase
LGVTEAFRADQSPDKVNLGVGVYQDEHGKTPLFGCVAEAEERLAAAAQPRGYLPQTGLPAYLSLIQDLVFGAGNEDLKQRTATVQSLSGTGALKLGADFLRQYVGQVVISDPSWENHRALFTKAGLQVDAYRYYDWATGGLDFAGMTADLEAVAPGTVVVLHACCHNPTGVDPHPEQWADVAAIIGTRGLIPFIDMAYQGFADGLEQDAAVVRAFASIGVPLFVGTSFSKNMGLYGERVGSLSVVTESPEAAARVTSQLKVLVRTNYSNPPTHGEAIVTEVLGDPRLRGSWEAELTSMRERIKRLRAELQAALTAAGFPRDPSFITAQTGMFSYTGLSPEQMQRLRSEYHVYGLNSGRICVAALNDRNLERVASALTSVS